MANHDPSFRVGLDSPKRGSRTSLDGRSRAHRGVRRRRLPFHGVPSHGENFNAYTNRRGCARASRRVPRLAFKLSRGSLLAGIADRSSIDSNPFRHRLRATPSPAKTRVTSTSERLTLNLPLHALSRLAPRSPSPARPTPRTVIPRTSSGASPTRRVRASDAKPPACDFIHIQVVHSSIHVYTLRVEKLASSRREIRRLDFVSEFSPECIPL